MRVVLYARVSTQRQADQNLSIPHQFRRLEEYCRAHRYEIAGRFHDPGASATDDNRPAFREMIDFALDRANGVECILVLTTSRFFRDALGAKTYKRRLREHGVRVVSITQEVADGPHGELAEGIHELFDEHESRNNACNTLRGMQENARQGWFNGSTPPYGYAVESVRVGERWKSKLVPNPAEAETV